MIFGRGKKPGDATGPDGSEEGGAPDTAGTGETVAASTGSREGGPWDSTEFDVPEDDGSYVDLGGLVIKGRVGVDLQVPTDPGTGAPSAAVLVSEQGALELRAFAAPRSGGMWSDVRSEICAEVERVSGAYEEVHGPFGPELRIQVPARTPEGKDAVQPSRIVGVEGPRWLLRGTFLGRAAMEPEPDGILEQVLRDVVVVRGADAMRPRDQISLVLPAGAVRVEDADDADETN